MASDSHQHIYNIPAGQPFLQRLADMLLQDPTFNGVFAETFPLADFTILLQNRRAARRLQDILLTRNNGKPLFMPRIRPLGDIDEEELLFDIVDYAEFMAENVEPKQVISPFMRETELLRLVMAWGKHTGRTTSMAQCVALTADLVRFLNQAQTEEIDFAKLADIVPDQFSDNWQQTIDFLKIITKQWPLFKQDKGLVDGVEWRSHLLDLQNRVWTENPPTKPIIAAGTTGSIPAVARLLKCIAGLPLGAIILPGLDMDMSSSSWAQLEYEPAHPQAGFFHLLKTLDIERENIRIWPQLDISPAQAARNHFVNLALLPAQETSDWVTVGKTTINVTEAIENLHFIEAPDTYSEAGVIALAMREILETPKARAILVTKDRNLARHVVMQLERWGIDINDTAGTPLARKPAGSFLRLILKTIESDFAPVDFLALLKHPFCCLSMARPQLLSIIRDMERLALRGVRPPALAEGGLASLVAQLKLQESRQNKSPQYKETFHVLEKIKQAFAPLTKLDEKPPLCALAKALIEVANILSQKTDQQIAAWQKQDGEKARQLLTELAQIDKNVVSVPRRDWLILFEHFLAQCPVWDNHDQHPRLSIMGTLEARLMHADLIILGGLNEGSWPPVPDTGPWVSRPMCETLGMTQPERQQGLSAHDFVQAVCAPHVLMTRATKEGGTPTIAARWLTRMQALLKGLAGEEAALARDERLLDLWQEVDKVAQIKPAPRPAPCPPIEARPTRLPVTQIQHLQSNPYAIYARYVLGLYPLDPLEADIDGRLRGTFLHKVLENFCRQWPDKLP
ncbi:MAG: double-strand break repair protein AddB, partial [Alphaproteobacteria bacterium]|nr:double-strand break repair protein AddB [Alphaproteobacteria bacterium]